MRRKFLAGAVLVLALAGCTPTLPSSVDQNLTDDWSAPFPAVVGYVPSAGVCIPSATRVAVGYRSDVFVDCSVNHMAETSYVGEFPATAKPESKDPADIAAALAKCDVETNAYLGGRPWWDGRLRLQVTTPSSAAWAGGARWFRCDLIQIGSVFDTGNWIMRTGSLHTDFPADLKIGCSQAKEKNKEIDTMPEVPCAAAHNSEYAGSYRDDFNTPYPKSIAQWNRIHSRCQTVVAKYVGVTPAKAAYFGLISSPTTTEEWAQGDHLVHCAIWFDKKTTKGSAKGTKGKGLPV